MLHSLVAYDAAGNIVATLDHMVAKDEEGNVVGLVDFAAHEEAGGKLRDIWESSAAVGSATWPQWLGGRAHDFKVELDPNPGKARARIAALVHKRSGHRHERHVIEAEIERRHAERREEAKREGDVQRRYMRMRRVSADVIAEFSDPPARPVYLGDLLGGPGKPLLLDEDGRTKVREKVERPQLPVVQR